MKKKLGAWCLVAAFLVILCQGCSARLSLEDYTWTMTTVFDKDGTVIACAPDQKDVYPQARAVMATLSAENGRLVITWEDTGKSLTGTYRQTEINPDGGLYELYMEELGKGFGGCGVTKHRTGENVPTFAVQFPEYASLYFTGKQP